MPNERATTAGFGDLVIGMRAVPAEMGQKERSSNAPASRESGNPVRREVSGYWSPAFASNDTAVIPKERESAVDQEWL
jgi:hypothetical protein